MRSVSYLIRKNGRFMEFYVPSSGDFDSRGRYVPLDPTPMKARAVVMHLTSDDLRLYEAGVYTSKDAKVITFGRVPLPVGTTFSWQGSTYEILERTDNSHLVDAQVHVAVKVVTVDDPA